MRKEFSNDAEVSQSAKDIFSAQNLGFETIDNRTWSKDGNTFRSLSWQDTSELEELVELQSRVWGMPVREAVPSNLFSIVGDTGGTILACYGREKQPIGFVFTVGTISGRLILHMIGVEKTSRYVGDVGWNLAVLQGMAATEKGISQIDWTYDPLLGGNARLYIEKLGGVPYKYTVNKYGFVPSTHYGESPTDRFTVAWNLQNPRTLQRIDAVKNGTYTPLNLSAVESIPVVATVQDVQSLPEYFKVEIPGDSTQLPSNELDRWRMSLRAIATSVMPTEIGFTFQQGDCFPIGFATGIVEGTRKSFYVFQNGYGQSERAYDNSKS